MVTGVNVISVGVGCREQIMPDTGVIVETEKGEERERRGER